MGMLFNGHHSKKNWSAQLGNLLAHSELFNKPCTLLGNALLCARLCITWTPQVLGHLSAQEVHKFVWIKCKLPEDVHFLCTQVSKDLKCPSGAHPCAQKSISKQCTRLVNPECTSKFPICALQFFLLCALKSILPPPSLYRTFTGIHNISAGCLSRRDWLSSPGLKRERPFRVYFRSTA